ncbi:hypothetical protein Tco_0516469 [Tanacetum coccineum]
MTKWPTYTSDINGFCNGGELPGMVRVGCMTYFQDHKWYDELADGDPSIYQVKRFEVIKYSFDADDEYVAIKEHEYFDHSRANIDACQDYQELFRIMNEGWLVTKATKE